MKEFYVYRHKYHKNIYLARNWSYCGGNANTEFYYATKDMITALKDANCPNFLSWTHSFLDEDGKTMLKAQITDSKEVDIDGYTGTIAKELSFPVTEFEKVTFAEVET